MVLVRTQVNGIKLSISGGDGRSKSTNFNQHVLCLFACPSLYICLYASASVCVYVSLSV